MPSLPIPWLSDMNQPKGYAKVAQDFHDAHLHSPDATQEPEIEEAIEPPQPPHNLRQTVPWLLVALLSSILFYVLLVNEQMSQQQQQQQGKPQHLPPYTNTALGLNCGNSSAAALRKGCKFSMITTSWIPAACFDTEANDEYRAWANSAARAGGAFPYFKRMNDSASRFRDEEEWSRWEGMSWTTREEHRAHCAWMLPVLAHRAFVLGTKRVALEHTRHCANASLDMVLRRGEERDGKDGAVSDIHNFLGFEEC